jgi:hypothetical protein
LSEPGARDAPISLDGGSGQIECSGGLIDIETAKESAFHYCCSSTIDFFKLLQRCVQLEELGGFERSGLDIFIECDKQIATAPFGGVPTTRSVDQHFTHRACDEKLEMCSISGWNCRRPELEIRLVYQCSRAQGFAPSAANSPCDPPKLVVRKRKERVDCVLVSISGSAK